MQVMRVVCLGAAILWGEAQGEVAPSPFPEAAFDCPNTPEGHFDCGKQLGARFAGLIGQAFSLDIRLQKLYEKISPVNSTGSRIFKMLADINSKRYPLLMQEVHGMAEGSGQPQDFVVLANLRQEVETALANASARTRVPDACTDVMVVREGVTGFAHNEDYDSFLFDKMYLVRQTWRSTSPAVVSVSYVSFTYPGVLPGWAPGWNSHGLAMTWNVLYPLELKPGGGVAVAFVCRDVLEKARSAQEAVSLAAPRDLALGQNLNVGVVSAFASTLLTAETAPGGASNVKTVSGTWFHANEYLRMRVQQSSSSLTSSKHRRATFEATEPKPQTLADALHVLGDTSDREYPIFRRHDATQEDTLFTVAFDLLAGQVTVYRNNPRFGAAVVVLQEKLWAARVVGMKALCDCLEERAGVLTCGGEEDAGKNREDVMKSFLPELEPPAKEVVAVVCGADFAFNYYKLAKAANYLRQNPGALFVATNPDPRALMAPGTFFPAAGSMWSAIAVAAGRQPDIVCGKPSETLARYLLSSKGLPPETTCMVGDRTDTDIAFGRSVGMQTLFVASGSMTEQEVMQANRTDQPHYVAESIAILGQLLKP